MVKFVIIWKSVEPKPEISLVFNYLFGKNVLNNFVVLMGNLFNAL